MDFSGFDAFTVGAFIGSLIKAFMSDSKATKAENKAREIEEARIATKIERDKEFQQLKMEVAVLNERNATMAKQLDEGTTRFAQIESDLKQINKNLNTIIGKLSEMRRSGHGPEAEPV